MLKLTTVIGLTITIGVGAITASATPQSIEQVFRKIGGENHGVKAADLKVRFQEESLKGAKSRLYPSLSLSFTANDGENGAVGTSAQVGGMSSSPSGGLGEQSSGITELATEGWASQVSLGYFVFSQFAIEDSITRSENDLANNQLNKSQVFDEKRSQFLQLLLEWQLLEKIKKPLSDATQIVGKIRGYSKGKSSLFYDQSDRINLEEKTASVEFYNAKVNEGQALVEAAILALVPSLTAQEIRDLPKVAVGYELPEREEIKKRFEANSRNHKMNLNDMKTASSYRYSASWSRAWVPNIYWSGGYSHSGDYMGTDSSGGFSTSILFSFNLFDGFYSQARRAQAEVAVSGAEVKTQMEKDRRVLLLKHKRMEAVVSRSEYRYKKAIAEKKKLRYLDLKNKFKRGIGTKLEVSLGTLDWAKAELESLDVLKKKQQALLDIAIELNEWDKVKIYEEAN